MARSRSQQRRVSVRGGRGLLVEFAPGDRHEVIAASNARLLLLLTSWPGMGHSGAMTIREKLYARRHAAKRAHEGQASPPGGIQSGSCPRDNRAARGHGFPR